MPRAHAKQWLSFAQHAMAYVEGSSTAKIAKPAAIGQALEEATAQLADIVGDVTQSCLASDSQMVPGEAYNRDMKTRALFGFLVFVGCGEDGGGGADAPNIPAIINITGTVAGRSATTSMPVEGATLGAYRNGADATPVATTTSGANGNYTLAIVTNGLGLDGYVKGTSAGYMDTYVYPPEIVTADLGSASVNMVTPSTFDLLASTLCGANQQSTNGTIAVIVVDEAQDFVAGATVASAPGASKYCYNSGGTPNRNVTSTDVDGIAYMFDVTGQVTVSAMKPGATFSSHRVTARPGMFTTTLITP